jgi:CSLREA domain-containing protein
MQYRQLHPPLAAALGFALVLCGWGGTANAHGGFLVNTTADGDDGGCDPVPEGDCSLREAIEAANTLVNDHPDAPDSIGFDFGQGAVAPFTIELDAPLPTISESVIINGGSEPRYIVGRDHVPVIIIDSGGFDYVFRVRAPNTLISALAMTNAVVSGIDAENADFLLVQGCYFGIHPATGARLGDDPEEPAFGSHAIRVSASYRPRIGGESELAGNVIAGAGAEAILIEGGDDLVLIGNHIGVDPTGREARPNSLDQPAAFAVAIDGAGSAVIKNNVISANKGAALLLVNAPSAVVEQNRIGVDTAGRAGLGNGSSGIRLGGEIGGLLLQANVISANGGDGVVCAAGASGEWIMLSNVIGVDGVQSQVLPNLGHGVSIESGCDGAAIGTIGIGQGNVIAHNQGAGVRLSDGATYVRGNSMFLNGQLGIDAGDEGVTANDVADALLPVNFPEIRELVEIDGGLAIHGCTVGGATLDVYEALADPSGFGEGVRHLGTIIEGGLLDGDESTECSPENDAAFSFTLETSAVAVTLTATTRGRTSEFSPVYPEANAQPDPECDADMACQAPTPVCNPVLGRCEVCIDDAEGVEVDLGCSDDAPLCLIAGTDDRGCSAVIEAVPPRSGPASVPGGGCSITRPGSHNPSAPVPILILVGWLLTRRAKKCAPNHINT